MTLVFGVSVFFAFNSISHQSAVLTLSQNSKEIITLLGQIIKGVSVFIAVILGFLIVYANRFLVRRRKREFGIYLTLGMRRGDVSRILMLETLIVGLASLVVGLALGFALSQGLLYVTAACFAIKITTFTFAFSTEALWLTIIAFVIMFTVSMLFSVASVARTRIINLIHADRMNEQIKLRSLSLSVGFFVLSLVTIGVAYKLLLKNGLMELDGEFIAATVLVCIGTLLFFYSASGFLLRFLKSNKRFYYRGLNAFTLRQLNAKVNVAFISISVVCMTLFLAITSTCTGFAVVTTVNKSLEASTPYDYSYTAFVDNDQKTWGKAVVQMKKDQYDVAKALQRDLPSFDRYVAKTEQSNYYYEPQFNTKSLFNDPEVHHELMKLGKSAVETLSEKNYVQLMRLSDFNAQLKLQGKAPLTLANNQYAVCADFSLLQKTWKSYIKESQGKKLAGTQLDRVYPQVITTAVVSSTNPYNPGFFVIPDNQFPTKAKRSQIVTNMMFKKGVNHRQAAKVLNDEGMKATGLYDDGGWPYRMAESRVESYENAQGISTLVSYLAIYIGLVLLIACAAILSLQQLSEAADNTKRYGILNQLGAPERATARALFTQIGIYFLFPLLLAIAHSTVALSVTKNLVAIFGYMDIAEPLLITVGLFLVVYGGYFAITYATSRGMLKPKRG